MPRFDTHLCLVSAQPTPNLLPVLDPDWRPRRVVLATTPGMKAAAAALQEVLRTKVPHLVVDLMPLDDAYDYTALTDAFLDFLARDEHRDPTAVALNVTGGTKLMAVAAQQVFSVEGRPVFYVNIDTDEVVLIGQNARSQPLRAALKVREFLGAHGFQVVKLQREPVTGEQRDLAARVIDHVGAHGPALGLLNRLAASDSARKELRVELDDRQADSIALREMIALFEQAGQLTQRGRQLRFPSEAARFFVNGGWLELHAYRTVQDLAGADPGITDVVMNVELLQPDGKTRNEIDVAFLYRNTLHLLECKTANLAAEGSGGDVKATEALYKLESLRKIGGLRTRAMVLDYRGALSSNKADRSRAENAHIEVVSQRQLGELKGQIQRIWLRRAAA